MGITADGGKGAKGSEWQSASGRRQLQTRTTHPWRHAKPPPPPLRRHGLVQAPEWAL